VLWQGESPEELVCRTGHSFGSLEEFERAQTEALENLLWAAERALRERAVVLRRLAHRVSDDTYSGRTFKREAQAATKNADRLRQMLERNTTPDADGVESH
jgi:two-component system chemotaxis response regulator CheB